MNARRAKRKEKQIIKKTQFEEIPCIVVLASHEDEKEYLAKRIEDRQLKVITEYADAHNLLPIKIVRAGCISPVRKRAIILKCIEMMQSGRPDAILLINMEFISDNVFDCYYKIGLVKHAGYRIFTVENGEVMLGLPYEGVCV